MNRLATKKIFLVTGGLGFIGSHFIEKCLSQGHDVVNVDKGTYAAHFELNALFIAMAKAFKCDYRFICRDIGELQYEEFPVCDIIVNFAAESHVDTSINDSAVFVRSNVIGMHNLLDLVKRHKNFAEKNSLQFNIPTFVQISTDEVFGDVRPSYFCKENDRHLPSNPYSATKSAAEQLLTAWGRTYDIPYIITRSTNSYGPRQYPEKLIPMAISRLTRNEKAIMHGDGSYVRNWVHVTDSVEGIWMIIDRGETHRAYHISSNEEFSVKQIIQKICSLLNKNFDNCINQNVDRLGVDYRYALDCSSLRALGWKPTKTLDETLRIMVQSELRSYVR